MALALLSAVCLSFSTWVYLASVQCLGPSSPSKGLDTQKRLTFRHQAGRLCFAGHRHILGLHHYCKGCEFHQKVGSLLVDSTTHAYTSWDSDEVFWNWSFHRRLQAHLVYSTNLPKLLCGSQLSRVVMTVHWAQPVLDHGCGVVHIMICGSPAKRITMFK